MVLERKVKDTTPFLFSGRIIKGDETKHIFTISLEKYNTNIENIKSNTHSK